MTEEVMRNSYDVVVRHWNTSVMRELIEDRDTICDSIDTMISFFEETEEYEKCMKLVYIKNDITAEYLTRKLIKDEL
tara:strand:+ start:1255 stop:1485 length:231 start_codon:yes stop_codon:yes gene_type:complete